MTGWRRIASPLGELVVVADDDGVTAIHLPGDEVALPAGAVEGGAVADRAAAQLGEWFDGRRERFDLPLAPIGTDFQRRVWAALEDVPYGATATYGDIARAIGQPTATRAVGAANGRNPIPIVVPCHRVVGADGSLTGYSGGSGLTTKRWLLGFERGETTLAV